jgi:hypothetical protein
VARDIWNDLQGRRSFCEGDGLVKNVAFIEWNLVLAEELQQLGFEIFFLVMCGLASNLFFHGGFLGFADGKDGIAFLPGEGIECREGVVDPGGRSGLDGTHEIGNGVVGAPTQVEVDVVFDAADVVEDAFFGADDAADAGIEALGDIGSDPGVAIFGAEDDVEEDLGVRAGHESFSVVREIPSPLRGDTGGMIPYPRVARSLRCAAASLHPWLHAFAPIGARRGE